MHVLKGGTHDTKQLASDSPGLDRGRLLGFLGSEGKDCCQQESMCLEQALVPRVPAHGAGQGSQWCVMSGCWKPPAKKGLSSPQTCLGSVILLSVKALLCEVLFPFSFSKDGQCRKPQQSLPSRGEWACSHLAAGSLQSLVLCEAALLSCRYSRYWIKQVCCCRQTPGTF